MKPTCVRTYADQNQIERTKSVLVQSKEIIQQHATMHQMAVNETRLKILYALFSEDQLCVCDLTDILGISTPAVSQHLAKLRASNLIESKREAQRIFYSLSETSKTEFQRTFSSIVSALPKDAVERKKPQPAGSSCCPA